MPVQFINKSTGQVSAWIQDSFVSQWLMGAGSQWERYQTSVQTTDSSGATQSMMVAPELAQYYKQADYALKAGELGVSQFNSQVGYLNAQTSAFTAQSADQLGRAKLTLDAFNTLSGPANEAKRQELLRGSTGANGIQFERALFGQAPGLTYADTTGAALDPLNPRSWMDGLTGLPGDGKGKGGHSSSGGGSDIAWKQKLEAAGIKVGDANPDQVRAAKRGNASSDQLRAMQDGRYGMSNRGMKYEDAIADPNNSLAQPGSGGAPPGVRVTNGHSADDTSGDHTPRNDDGTYYTGPLNTASSKGGTAAGGATADQNAPGATRAAADYEQQRQDQLAKSTAAGFPAPGPNESLPHTGAAAAGASPGASDYAQFYQSNPTMKAATVYGTPSNAVDMGTDRLGHVTRVTYGADANGQKPPDRYFLDDGTQVQRNPAANAPGAGLWVSGGPAQTTAPAQPTVKAVAPTTTTEAKAPVAPTAPSAPSSNSSNSNRDQGTINGRDQSTYSGDKTDAEKAKDRARKKEEERAGGGIDVIKHPVTIKAGEKGHDELHIIVPLQNPDVPIPAWARAFAQALEPGSRDQPMHHVHMADGGMLMTGQSGQESDTQGQSGQLSAMQGPESGQTGQESDTGGPDFICTHDGPQTCTVTNAHDGSVLGTHVPEAKLQPLLDSGQAVLADASGGAATPPVVSAGPPLIAGAASAPSPTGTPASPLHMAMGGMLYAPISGAATVKPLASAFNQKAYDKVTKANTAWAAYQANPLAGTHGHGAPHRPSHMGEQIVPTLDYVNSAGQVKVPTGKSGKATILPQYSATPYVDPMHWSAAAMRAIASDPVEMQKFTGILTAKGMQPESEFAKFYKGLGTATPPAWMRVGAG